MGTTADIHQQLTAIARAAALVHVDVAAGGLHGADVRWQWSSENFEVPANRATRSVSDRCYLTASLTKPVVAMMAVQLAAEGCFALSEPVRSFVPGFHRGPFRTITIRHLLTHTSGLPDMLPTNTELRRDHASLEEFVRQTAEYDPEFLPGSACRYSSMGIAVLAAIFESVSGQRCSELLERRVFKPCSMNQTWLGLPDAQADELMLRVMPCELPPWQSPDADWSWNSRYWRTLGAPWGGMISTTDDLGRFATMMLRDGLGPDERTVFAPAVIAASCRNQTRYFASLPIEDQRHRPWGFGWRQNWPGHSACFSDFLPRHAIGHWGATGTMMWINRRSQRWCVILTTTPYEISQPFIQRMSNLIAARVR